MTQTLTNGREIVVYSQSEPSSGDLFQGYRWRETTGGDTTPLYAWEWEWNGTYWLSSQLFSFAKDSNYGTYEAKNCVLPGFDLFFTEAVMSGRWSSSPATNDASNYYTERIYLVDASNGGRNQIANIDSSTYDPGSLQYMSHRITLGSHFSTDSTDTQISFESITTGSPTTFQSGIYTVAEWWFHYARK